MDPTDIAVSVKDGVVTLVGFVRRFTGKYEAQWAAKRVQGVVGIANDIEVRLPDADERPDPEIARDADAWENITVIVRDAWVMLQGHVEWQYQREAAERAVRPIKGVKGITNLILLEPTVLPPSEVRRKIEEAFKRNAVFDARSITVEVVGNEVILRGTVRSWSEYAEAERAAWAAPDLETCCGSPPAGARLNTSPPGTNDLLLRHERSR